MHPLLTHELHITIHNPGEVLGLAGDGKRIDDVVQLVREKYKELPPYQPKQIEARPPEINS